MYGTEHKYKLLPQSLISLALAIGCLFVIETIDLGYLGYMEKKL
jgi:hypothetical protein